MDEKSSDDRTHVKIKVIAKRYFRGRSEKQERPSLEYFPQIMQEAMGY